MAGTNILVRQKDLIAGSGISITPDTTSGNVTIAATSTAIDESRLLPTGGKEGEILSYQEGADRGNSDNVRLLLQNAMTDSANGNAAPAAVTTQGVTLTGDNNLLFDGNDSHVTAVLATDEIFAADKEWTIDFWMKPTANSSEWNYILTETRGDWGSHSIGLTWNKTKNVLEQDTGGYLASVIRSSNWPNDSVACAASEWHFVAVEKQKTASGWNLNYYLNGAIWLQVAFTADFVPFNASDNPFWFGGKTTDSGRWFKGEVNKLRVTMGARYGGKAFAVPDRLTDYATPAGQPVWVDGIDRSRLLPENPANGDIPCYSNEPPVGVNYNDANTVLLLQGSSDNTAAAPTSERLNGIVTGEFPVQEDGSILVNGTSNYITFNDADTRRVFSGEFTLETYIKTTQFTASGKRQDTNWCVVYRNDTSSVTAYQWLLLSDFFADAGKFGIWPYPQMSGETFPKTLINAEFQHVAIDVYMVDGVRKFTMYRNGVPYHTGNYWSTTPADWSSSVSAAMRLFGEGTSGGDDYLSNASVMSLRVSNIARYKGVSFDPPADGKYLNPPAGYWGKLNKSELVQSVNGVAPNESGNVILDASTIIDNSRLLPVLDALPEGYEGSLLAVQRGDGKVADENTLRLMHFNDDVRDVVTDETGTLKGNASITPTGYFDGALSINHAVVSSLSFNGLTATPTAWTMDFRVKLGRFSGDAPIVMIGTNLNETQTSLIRVDSSYIDIQATYNQRVIYKTHSLQLDTWYHFALTYDGTTYKFYVDGKLFGSGESANQFDFTRKLWFGSFYDYSTSYVSDCTIDEFRLSNVVRWTENFTPPDAPYGESLYNWGIGPKLDESRLLPETGSVSSDSVGNPVIFKAISRIDNTYWLCLPLNEDTNDRSTYGVATGVYGTVNIVSNAPSSPGGSAFFNGSSCLYGTLPAQFGASDFTVRFWMMAPTISSSSQTIFSTRYGDQTDASTFALLCTTEGRLFIYSNGDITSRTDTPFTLQPSVWYHVAVVRKSGVLTIYVNGEVYNSATFTNSLTRQIFGLGASWTGSSYSEAGTVYLTSLDVLNYAAYDGAFTTPAYQPGILAGMGYQVAEKGFVPSDSKQLLPANPDDQDLTIYRVFPEESAPQNLTSAISDPDWEVTWSGAYSGRVGWWAFDSDQSTMWCTYQAAVGDWLCWEYKGVEGKVLLRRYSIAKASGNGDCPTGWKIQGSNDGSIWVDLDEQTGQSFPDNNAKEYTIPNNSTPYKFHRFYLLSWNTSNMIGTFKAWSWINSTEERKVWLPINKSELVVNDARLLPDAPSDTTNSYWLNSGPVTTQVSPASYAGSTDATWTMELSGAFEDGDISTLFDSDTTNGVSGTLGLETFGTVRWIRKDQVPYRIDRIVLRAQNSDIGAFPKTIYLSGYDKSTFGPAIVQEFNAPVWEAESDTSTYATSLFTRVCTLEVNAPAFQSYDYSIVLGSGSGLETTLQAFAAYQLDTETAWKQLNTATTTTAGLMAAADKVKLDALQQAATYINIATDFNTYKTAGSYFLKGAVHTNGPLTDSYAGTLVVVAPAELRYTTQYFTQLYTNKTFVRTYSRDNSAWSAWNRVIVDTDLATTTVAGLMSATDREKSIGLTTRGFYPNALAKSGAVDFNEVIDHGFYFIGGDTPHLNYPETYQQNGGTLQVIRNGNYLTQTFIPLNINKAFIRSCLNVLSDSSERTFSAWQRMLTGTDQYSQKVVALADFDDYRTPGEYFFYTAAHLNSPDAPNNTAGWLVVEIVSGGEHVKQTYYALNTRKTYIRTYNNRNQVWLPWLQQLSVEDITASKARPGYFKLPGGIIVQWGAVLDVSETKTFDVTLPLAFPHLGWVSLASGTSTTVATAAYFNGANALKVVTNVTGAGSFAVYWIAIGY